MTDRNRVHRFRVTTKAYGGEEKTRLEHARFIGLALRRLLAPQAWALEVEVDGGWCKVSFDNGDVRVVGATIGGDDGGY